MSNEDSVIRRWTLGVRRSTFSAINSNLTSSAAAFRRPLLAWYRQHGRDLPWRRTRDPYAILVSEFMLQQTQVATVIPYYNEWIRRFPDFAALARASEQEALHAWQGLGYYSRARNLRTTAIAVKETHGGHFPREMQAIRALPGIGRYTANAVTTFAFDESVPIVEANIARLLARLIDLQTPIDTSAGREVLWSHAEALLPNGAAGTYNSALMDLGALVCTIRPKCEMCPVRGRCAATDPSALPRKKPRHALQILTEHHGFFVRRRQVLLEQSQRRWRGMWMLPRLAKPPASALPLHTSEFPFTHHRITLTVFGQNSSPGPAKPSQRWFRIDALDSLPLPSPHRRALEELLGTASHRPS